MSPLLPLHKFESAQAVPPETLKTNQVKKCGTVFFFKMSKIYGTYPTKVKTIAIMLIATFTESILLTMLK